MTKHLPDAISLGVNVLKNFLVCQIIKWAQIPLFSLGVFAKSGPMAPRPGHEFQQIFVQR